MAAPNHHYDAGYVAIYVRISVDKQGRREGVDRQERWGRAYAARCWPGVSVRVFADNDVSAFDDNADRPGYDALRDAIRNGEVLHLWTVEQTRIEANNRRWPGLAADLDAAGLREIHTDRDGVVPLNEVADIKQAISHHERKRLRERLRDTMEDLAVEGRPRSGAVYGYSHGADQEGRRTLDVVPVEAAVLRWMADVVLAGWPLAQVARRLNDFNAMRLAFGLPACLPKRAGRPRLKGGEVVGYVSPLWVPAKVRAVLTKPSVAGLRAHNPQRVKSDKPLRRGTWTPILDETTWKAVRAFLGEDRDIIGADGKPYRTGGPKAPVHGYPLTGYLFCALCGHHLNGKGRKTSTGWQRRYACIKNPPAHKGCGRTYVVAEALEAYVTDQLLTRLQSPEFLAQLAADSHAEERDNLAAQLRDIETSRVRLATRYGEGALSDSEWDAARAGLDRRHTELMAELAAIPAPPVDVDPHEVVEGWDHLDVNERRQLMSLFLERVDIGPPTTQGRPKFDTERATVVWR